MRMNFNGCSRKVVVDDRLPVSKTHRLLHVTDRNFPNLLWPALLEKAYLKVRGGYDFPGSNSGTDIWTILGWIPEQVFLQHEDTVEDQLWYRLLDAHQYGDVLATLGTSSIAPEVEEDSGLAGDHDYAVLDVKEHAGQRLLLIKNPWLKATTWKGSSASLSVSEENDTPGTYWMSMHAVTQNFMTMYLNWNPGLFTHRQDFHFSWDLSSPSRSPPGCINGNPQYTLRGTANDTVWLLLCRHFQDRPATSPGLPELSHSSDRHNNAYISLYAFQGRDRRVYLSKGVTANSLYVDAPQTLLRLEVTRDVPFIIAASEQHLPQTQHTFSLFAFSRSPLIITPASPQHTDRATVSGAWTSQTAGGTPSASTYGLNPQYVLTLPHASRVTLLLENPESDLSINVALTHSSGGKRIHNFRARNVVCSSGTDYRRGCALATTVPSTSADQRDGVLPAGSYTIIASTFDPGRTGSFILHADTDCAATLRPIPREGAGLLRFTIPDAVFAPGARKLVAPLNTQRLARTRLVVRHAAYGSLSSTVPRGPPSPIRVAIEVTLQQDGASGRGMIAGDAIVRAMSGASAAGEEGAFSDAPSGVRIEDIDVRPAENGRCWLVLERLGRGPGAEGRQTEERVTFEGFADVLGAIDVGDWRIVDDY
jgi:calpain-7